MKLSTRARYALRMMIDIARNGDADRSVSLREVSERTGISRGYLEQLALTLRNARILRSSAGRFGGYRLARPADEITLGDIVEASIGAIRIVDCVEDPDSCPRKDCCECRLVYRLINRRIAEVLQGLSLADLLDPGWAGEVEGAMDAALLPT